MRGTHQTAEMAANAFIPIKDRLTFFIQRDSLMAAIGAGDNTAAAAQTGAAFKLGENNAVPFQNIRRFADRGKSQPDNILYGGEVFLLKVVVEAGFQVINDN